MRIALHAGQLLQPVPGGIGRYVTALVRTLPAAGVPVEPFAAGPRPRGIPDSVGWSDLGWPRGALRYELWHRARRPAVRVGGQVLHAPSLAVPPRGTRPLVVTVHDIAFLRHPSSTTSRGRRFHERGLALARRDADAIVAVSRFTGDELLREGFDAARVHVIPNGCDPAPPLADGVARERVAAAGITGRYVLTVGTVEPRKRLPVLVGAFRAVRARHPDLTLAIVGPDGWGDPGRIDGPGVLRLGRLPWSQIDALYRRAELCCFTSIYEGFGLPAAEAIARGCPVVAPSGGALAEVIGDAGVLVEPDDADATAVGMLAVLDDPVLRADLARRGPARTAATTWASSAAAHARLYAALAPNRER